MFKILADETRLGIVLLLSELGELCVCVQTSGIRLGTPAITTRGAKEDLMIEIAEMIETVLSNVENEEVIAQVRARVNETMKKYPLFAD